MAGAPKRHKVVIPGVSGEPDVFPMKEWLRLNPDQIPSGSDPTSSTSYQLRRALKKQGWELEELQDQVLLIRPDEHGDTSFADSILADASADEGSESDDEILDAQEVNFGLERDLQIALRQNLAQLEPGMQVADGGRERTTEAGRVDITARDAEGAVVAIELKAGTASPNVVAQVLAYMSALAGDEKTPVRGIIVAGEFHKRVILAARAVPQLQLKRYAFQFSFESVE